MSTLDRLVSALYTMNGCYLTPIQEKAVALIRDGHDIEESVAILRPFSAMNVGAPGSQRRREQEEAQKAWEQLRQETKGS